MFACKKAGVECHRIPMRWYVPGSVWGMRASKFWENQRPSVYTDDERYLGTSRLETCSLSKNNVNITAVQKLDYISGRIISQACRWNTASGSFPDC